MAGNVIELDLGLLKTAALVSDKVLVLFWTIHVCEAQFTTYIDG